MTRGRDAKGNGDKTRCEYGGGVVAKDHCPSSSSCTDSRFCFVQNFETAKYWEDRYKESTNTLINVLTSDPSNRTKRVAQTRPYATEPIKSDPLLDY